MVAADQPTDQRALEGVAEGKAIFDVNLGNPSTLVVILDVVSETLDGLAAHGVEPDLIVAFRGPSVRFVTADESRIPLEQVETAQALAERVAQLAERGVRFEACGIATRMAGVDNASLIPGVEPVANTFNSLIGYQTKGYAIVPIM
jgi:intracellular sulfur oxidation DsrE/DsrF family protein